MEAFLPPAVTLDVRRVNSRPKCTNPCSPKVYHPCSPKVYHPCSPKVYQR
ncbi:MAG: hypothetical protein HQL74_12435 [Magnetococcales bacterium]|nr:hypothetical protein [Magnetococcales bacterium]